MRGGVCWVAQKRRWFSSGGGYTRPVRWTADECVAALRGAAPEDPGASLLKANYDAWRRENPGHPGSETIVYKFGTWADAVWAAGLISEYEPFHARAPEVRGCSVERVVPARQILRTITDG